MVAFVASIVAAILIHVMTRPLGQLMEGNRRVARGDFGLRLEVRSGDEFGRLAGSYNQMADEIQRSRELAESYLASLRSNAEHLEEANRALQQSNAELAKASRMKSEFLAVMSHELRTPLNVIIGFSEVLLDRTFGDLNAKQGRYVENVHSSGRHLLSLINDILDLSKVEAGRMQVAPEPIDLRQSLEEIHGLVRDLAARKDVALRFEPVPTLTPVTDLKIFKQVLLNLLSNAIKFTPAGGRVDLEVRCLDGRSLRADPATRSLAPERRLGIMSRRVLVVEVRDTGVGIALDDHEKIFQAFQQVDASYARKQEGTGLGLALTRKLVLLLGGDIWFESVENTGSKFWFYLPFEYNDGDKPAESRSAPIPHEDPEVVDSEGANTTWTTPEALSGDVGIGTGVEAVAHNEWPWGDCVSPANEEPTSVASSTEAQAEGGTSISAEAPSASATEVQDPHLVKAVEPVEPQVEAQAHVAEATPDDTELEDDDELVGEIELEEDLESETEPSSPQRPARKGKASRRTEASSSIATRPPTSSRGQAAKEDVE
jgi:signal transduction histidine kinase